ncbi:Rid family detoxifying hydrolase [Haladaptatus sp. DFWS20]|uniref:Rid family detoxifying hydrolase n=1 Tax=Haladaptatus sp. DFWS20 TaxID=3403467 RepID=UPI003EBECC25
MKRIISTDDAPAAVGAYSQATTNGDVLVTAGQLPLTTDGELLDGSIVEQTRQCLRNVEAILESEDLAFENVLKTTIFLDDIDDFDEFNEAYSEFFQNDPPARSAVGVDAVPKGASIEIEAIATKE